MGAAVYVISYFTTGWLVPVLTALVGGVLYLVLLIVFRVFSRSELSALPLGKRLVALNDRIYKG